MAIFTSTGHVLSKSYTSFLCCHISDHPNSFHNLCSD